MKRYLMGLAFLAVMVLCQLAITPKVSAQDYYCATDGRDYNFYVITETINHMKGGPFLVDVREVSANGTKSRVLKWEYYFDEGQCWATCKTDGSYTPRSGRAKDSDLAISIIRTAYHYKYGDQYNSYID